MSRTAFLGVDTSCYTTSLALVGEDGELLSDERQFLPVAEGEHGLRQSDALFHHVRQLPLLLSRVEWAEYDIKAVGVSDKPRPQEGSYMPVFLAGVSVAETASRLLGVPLFHFSHQEGHIQAGLWQHTFTRPFLAVHLSGGTSELLKVTPTESGFAEELLGGTSDLSAGQMIDRVGVALGLPFPAGPSLERLAQGGEGRLTLPSSVQGLSLSFSGPCSAALRFIEQRQEPAEIAFATLRSVANALEKLLRNAREETSCREVLIVGGVASNLAIRQRLSERVGRVLHLHFGSPALSSDNAAGIAMLARRRYKLEGKEGK